MKETISSLKFAWRYSKKQKSKLVSYMICNSISIVISVFIPILSAKIIVNLTSNNFEQLILISIVILVVELIRNTVSYFSRYFTQIIYRESFVEIQTSLGSEIVKIKNNYIDSSGSGLFIQRLTNDTSKLADVFNVITMYLTNIITDIGIFVAILLINKTIFIYVSVMTFLIYLLDQKRTKIYSENDKQFRKKNEKISGFIGELVRGVRDLKMLNAEGSFIKELNNKVIELNKERYKMMQTERNYNYLRGALHDLLDAGFIFLIVYLLLNGKLAVASALIVYNYINRVTSIVNYLNYLLVAIRDLNLSAGRISTIIEGIEFPKETFGTVHKDKLEGNFEFKNVTFKYEDKIVLDNISFKVNANETVAFVGKSGAGKSTIFSLLCKMYDVNEGEITLDGININELDKDTIRGNITIINQNPYIFNLSIKDNLKLVKENLTDEEMIEACKLACLHDFIMSLKDGYDTIVGEGGITLSGGQKQRLAIARALVQKTEIILFDEATSALDNETQASIQKAIENLKSEYTILIIAHRLSTIVNSDRILFLNEGKIESLGTHEQLLQENNNYKKLYEAELKDN